MSPTASSPTPTRRRGCKDTDPVAPAKDAGLLPGDRIVGFNGTEVSSWEQLRELIRGNEDGVAVLRYERDGEVLEGRTSTTVEARPDDDGSTTLTEVGFLGVTPTTDIVTENGGPIYTIEQMGSMTVDTVQALGQLPVKVWDVAQAIVGVEERSPDSPVSVVGGSRFAGEVSSSDNIDVSQKLVFLLMLVASFNLFIGLFNFVPLLPLDGGHIASALWEAVRRGLARLRRLPDPGYVDAAKLLPVAYVVAGALMLMGVVLIVGDLVVPLSIET